MLMTLFRWEAKILNRMFKTERYDKLIQLQVKTPDEINYSLFFDMTPGVNAADYNKIIQSTNRLCRPSTRADIMQQEVIFLNQYIQSLTKPFDKSMDEKDMQNIDKKQNVRLDYKIEHVVIYSSLSKCRIWPKVLKSGIGFVPTLIHFYNSFTKQYGDWLDFKFDPVILTQKYTKIMKKVNMKKRDHPKLIEAVKNNHIEQIHEILKQLQQQYKAKNSVEQAAQINKEQPNDESSISGIINNIFHKNKAISHICCQNSSLETIKLLYQLGADFELLDDQKQTALFFAVKRGDPQIIKYLVQEVKVNLNHREYQDRTALYLAAFQGDLKIVDYLFKKGANPELSSKLDRTPLSKACYLGNVQVVKYLLSINVDMLKQDNKGRTALHNAVWGIEGGRDGKRRGHIILEDSPECAQLLLNAGHPIDLQDYDGFTPFFSAVSSNAVRSVRLLYNLKANIHHKTKNKESAVFIAAKYGHLDVLKILVQQYNLDYVEPDYHGFSPLCASITLETQKPFLYFCDLYIKNGIQLDFNKLVECCRNYETVNNIMFIKTLLFHQTQENDKQGNASKAKVIFLQKHLSEIVSILKKLKKQKKAVKQQLNEVNKKRSQYHKLKQQEKRKVQEKEKIQEHKQKQEISKITTELDQKIQKHKLLSFQRALEKVEEEQLTEDRQFGEVATTISKKQEGRGENNIKNRVKSEQEINKNNAFTALIGQTNKKLQSLRKAIDLLMLLSSHIVVQTEKLVALELKQQNMHYTQQNRQKIRTKLLTDYQPSIHKTTTVFLLSECIHLFNRGKKSQVTDIVHIIQQLAKTLNLNNPTIPPINIQQSSEYKQLAKEIDLDIQEFCRLKIAPHQSQAELNRLLLNCEVLTNLVQSEDRVVQTLFKLAKLRKTGTIIHIFNNRMGLGKFNHDQLVQILQQKGQSQPQISILKTQQNKQNQKLTLIQYCLVHGILDIATFLKQVCKLPHLQFVVNIHPYKIVRRQLNIDECNIDLQPVQEWVFNIESILGKMHKQEVELYKKYLLKQTKSQQAQHSIMENQQKKYIKFISCNNYIVVDTKSKLFEMEHLLSKSVLIGMDVQYYGYGKEDFICSVQISNGNFVFIIDPMSHLALPSANNYASNEQILPFINANLLHPKDIAQFLRRLMSDQNKVKIFHAYENDVKWLHQDFDLGSAPATQNTIGIKNAHLNRNVIDTSRIYNCCNRVKKGESVGLRTLCQKYLNFEMDKNFQRSDWRIRPLFKEMIQYASIDAEVLPYIFLLMLSQSQGTKAMKGIRQIFGVKRSMKGKGYRNTLIRTNEKNPEQEKQEKGQK